MADTENIKLRIYGLRVNKRQFLIFELLVLLVFVTLLVIYIYRDFTLDPADSEAIRHNRYYIYMCVFFIVWVIVEAQFFLNRFVKAQLKIIKKQKEKIDQQNTEIKESIHYAKRIQDAILLPERKIREMLQDSFVFFRPKDIVSGDFYWLYRTGTKILFAAVDCTGHGVPGAIVSMIANDALNRTVADFGITEPAGILDKIAELLGEAFEHSEAEVKDGMDLALCSLDPGKGILEYAGANNPLYRIRENELTEIKSDKQPVGKYTEVKPFTNHSMQVQSGDCYYLFSDGFPDQFGGPSGKKFKYRQFREFLLSISHHPMQVQKDLLGRALDDWMQGEGTSYEQVDDVCVFGVRVLNKGTAF